MDEREPVTDERATGAARGGDPSVGGARAAAGPDGQAARAIATSAPRAGAGVREAPGGEGPAAGEASGPSAEAGGGPAAASGAAGSGGGAPGGSPVDPAGVGPAAAPAATPADEEEGGPAAASGRGGDGAPAASEAASAPMIVTPALRTVLAWSEIVSPEGEDDLEPFPVPLGAEAEDEDAELAPVDALPEAAVDGTGQEATPVAADGATPDAGSAVALVPVAPAAASTVPAATPAGGGGGAAGGGGGRGRGTGTGAGGGRPRRRPLVHIVDRPMTIVEHLDELRRRLVWTVVAFVCGTALTFGFIGPVLRFTERPLRGYGVKIQAISPMEKLFAPIRLAAIGGILIASPVIIYQVVMYILPALTRRERKMLFSYLPATSLLFAAGLAFGYFVFEPVALHVAFTFLPGVITRPTLNNWVSFLIEYSVPFGLVFELPVVVVVLTRLGIVSPEALIKGRRYAIFGAVVVGEVFSPPADFIFTPSLIALPIIALYEISIQASKVASRRRLQDEADAEADADEDEPEA